MYPIERYLHFLKCFIGNMAHPEGSIVEGYLVVECMTLCSRYLNTIKTKFNCPERNYDGDVIESEGGLTIFCEPGKSLKGSTPDKLYSNDMEDAHFYILKNCVEIQPFLEEFSQIYSETSQQSSDVEWNRKFISWLQKKDYTNMMIVREWKICYLYHVALCHMSQDSKAILLMDIGFM
ncbi:uncharacterized protein LOC125876870 [Solanum stenotomum]|uniref:uncharacterized protein LOC125876870 n=1 Tax=Solanum stenotomum TaxID=172797 RepID=UPI0020D09E94|nr:uncharacterized protein LOC125876870 [Solanum stenotomum]